MIINPIIPIWLMLILIVIFFICLKVNKSNFVRYGIMLILVFLINLRIMIPGDGYEGVSNDLDVLFVIDTTISMASDDYDNKTRLEAVKEDCKYIADSLEGAKFSLITFDNSAKVLLPYTRDKDILMESLSILKVVGYYRARGSSLNVPIESMLKQLESSSKSEERASVVFFISDGEITNNKELDITGYAALKEYIDDGAVLGYGTSSGGYMQVLDENNEYVYVEDETVYPYTRAISKIDEENLNSIADSLGVNYINMSNQSNLDSKLKEIKKGVKYSFDSVDKSSYSDTYFIFVIPLLGLFIYEFVRFKRGL